MSTFQVSTFLNKVKDVDPDIRFMGLNDLTGWVNTASAHEVAQSEDRVLSLVVDRLDDSNSEVQNISVKSLAAFMRKTSKVETRNYIVTELCKRLSEKNDNVRDIAASGLRSALSEVPSNVSGSEELMKIIIDKIVELDSSNADVLSECLDVIAELKTKFDQIPNCLKIKDFTLKLLAHPRQTIRRKASYVLGILIDDLPEDVGQTVVAGLLEKLKNSINNDVETAKIVLITISNFARSAPSAVMGKLSVILDLIEAACKVEDDESKEVSLQTFESIVLSIGADLNEENVKKIIAAASEYLSYDPNYMYDDEEENGDEETMDIDDGDDEDFGDYSDDEDVSWKIRRSAARLLHSIASVLSLNMIPSFFKSVSELLVKRFGQEREENVRVEVISVYARIISKLADLPEGDRMIEESYAVSMDENSRKKRRAVNADSYNSVSIVEKAINKQVQDLAVLARKLRSKSQDVLSSIRVLLSVFAAVMTLKVGLESSCVSDIFGLVSELFKKLLIAEGHDNSKQFLLVTDALGLLKVAVVNNTLSTSDYACLAECFRSILGQQVPYKTLAETFSSLTSVTLVVRTLNNTSGKVELVNNDANLSTAVVNEFLPIVLKKVDDTESDLEVRKEALLCLSSILSRMGDLIQNSKEQIVQEYTAKLNTETFRLHVVKGLAEILQSSDAVIAKLAILEDAKRLSYIVGETIALLRQDNRLLRLSSAALLDLILKKYPVSQDVITVLLKEIKSIILVDDLKQFESALSVVITIVLNQTKNNQALLVPIRNDILPMALSALNSSTQLSDEIFRVVGGFFRALITVFPSEFEFLYSEITNPIFRKMVVSGSNDQQLRNSAKVCAILLSSPQSLGNSILQNLIIQYSEGVANPNFSEENKLLFMILVLGELAVCDAKVDYSQTHFKHKNGDVFSLLLNLSDNKNASDNVKDCCAYSLGLLASSNPASFLAPLLKQFEVSRGKNMISMSAIHESILTAPQKVEPNVPVWQVLIKALDYPLQATEQRSNLLVDCIAQLTVREGKAALVELKSLLKSSIKVRMEILSAIRIVFSLRKSEVVDPLDKRMEEFDKALGELIPDFLSLMHDDEDLNVRRICLAAFNSCLHNRPDLLKVSMSGLLESLYNETNVRQDLIRIVDMGPFKHKVDDGLETRKAAYECLYSLMDVSSVYMSIDQLKFFKMVVQGLSDPSQEIQLMCHLIMIKLCHSYHSSKFTAYKKKIATFFVNVEAQEKLVKPLKEILTTKLKDSAVKQDIEKHTEMVRSAIRVLVLVSVEFLGMKIVNNGKFIVISKQKNTFPAVEAYLNELCDNNSLNSYLRTILEEESV